MNAGTSFSFRQFVMNAVADGTSPSDAMRLYDEHCKGLARLNLAQLRGTGLLHDLYSPVSRMRRHDLRVLATQRRAQEFVSDLAAGKFDELCLTAGLAKEAVSNPRAPRPVVGHLKAPEFAIDPRVGVVQVCKLKKEAGLWDAVDVVEQLPGFMGVSMPLPAPDSTERQLEFRFLTADAADAAAKAMKRATFWGGNEEAALSVQALAGGGAAEPSPMQQTMEAIIMPEAMGTAERMAKDVEISAKAILLLDSIMGVARTQPLGTDDDQLAEVPVTAGAHVLQKDAPLEAKLDLQVLYLRMVHLFCYYSAQWCGDEWELHRSTGAAVLRAAPVPSMGPKPEAQERLEKTWIVEHDARLQRFLATARFQPPQLSCEFLKEEEILFRKACEEQTKQWTENKFQCKQCGRFFKGPDYVHKHIRKDHLVFLGLARRKHLEDLAAETYLASTPRPIVSA